MIKDMDNPKVTVIILNYQGSLLGDLLNKCVSSVLATNYLNFEVIFIDNGSTNGSFDKIRKAFSSSRLRFVKLSRNLGYAGGNNIGANLSTGKYLVFLNTDIIVSKEWMGEMVKYMEEDPTIGACQPIIYSLEKSNEILSIGGLLDRFGISYDATFSDILENRIFFVLGSALMVRKELFEHVSGFDSHYFLRCEEVDLCWRIRLAGYKVACVQTAKVYHVSGAYGATTRRTLGHSDLVYYEERNKLATFVKNCRASEFYLIILVILGILLQWLFATLTFKSHTSSYLRALLWNLKHFPNIYREKQMNKSLIRRANIFFKRPSLTTWWRKTKKYRWSS